MSLNCRVEKGADLAEYAAIRSRFEVRSRLLVEDQSVGRDPGLSTVPCEPWIKDYDAEGGGNPREWCHRFDTSGWTFFFASMGAERAGSAILLHDDPAIDMLEGRSDLGLVWDLRVVDGHRGQGIGRYLLDQVQLWARQVGCAELKVETQDINVPACRLYHGFGFELRRVLAAAYPELPSETMLLWYKGL